MNNYKQILSFDFDGVIHMYREGWKGIDNIYDEPTPGAQEYIREAQKAFKVIIHSSRCSEERGLNAIKEWLNKHNFPEVEVTANKPPAFITIDDRVHLFTGVFPDIGELLAFKPWNIK